MTTTKAGASLGLLFATAAVAAAALVGRDAPALAAPQHGLASCTSAPVGLLAPVTGPAAAIGGEQLHWAQFAVAQFNKDHGTKFKLNVGDTMINPAQAQTLATRFVSNKALLGVVGPAGSQEVEAVGPIFAKAKLAFISGSATRVSLTQRGTGFPTFFRVVPHDGKQSATDANYMNNVLKVKRVMIIDDQESYSTGLADAVEKILSNRGTDVQRESVSQKVTDFSALVSKIRPGTDVVFLPWQIPANAQLFGEQMREQGKTATIFGSDGLFSPKDFSIDGSYMSSFAPDITGVKADAALVQAFQSKYGRFGTFGPPTFLAVQVLLTAATQACSNGSATRAEVLQDVPTVKIKNSLLGTNFAFSSATHDPLGAKFFIFQVNKGVYTLKS